MFGLMTKAAHRREMAKAEAQWLEDVNRFREGCLLREKDKQRLRAEIDRLRPMADKWQAHLDRAQANFRKGK